MANASSDISESMRTPANAEEGDPRRANVRRNKEESSVRKSTADNEESSRAKERADKGDPEWEKSIIEIL